MDRNAYDLALTSYKESMQRVLQHGGRDGILYIGSGLVGMLKIMIPSIPCLSAVFRWVGGGLQAIHQRLSAHCT